MSFYRDSLKMVDEVDVLINKRPLNYKDNFNNNIVFNVNLNSEKVDCSNS